MRSGKTSVEWNMDVVMEVCAFFAGEAGAYLRGGRESCPG